MHYMEHSVWELAKPREVHGTSHSQLPETYNTSRPLGAVVAVAAGGCCVQQRRVEQHNNDVSCLVHLLCEQPLVGGLVSGVVLIQRWPHSHDGIRCDVDVLAP